jgi:uncharacterized repeat protein (TIGR01451 family)
MTYTLTLLNDSPLPMTDGVVTVTLPSSVTVLAHSPTPTTVMPGILVWRDLVMGSEAVQDFTWTLIIPREAALDTFVCHVEASWPGLTAPAELEMTALVSAYSLALYPAVSQLAGQPGTTVSHYLTVTNTGTLPVTVSLATSPSLWPVQIMPTQMTLPVDGVAPVTVTVTIPEAGTLLLAAPHVVTVTATVLEAPSVQVQAVLTTSVKTSVYLPLVLRGP